MKKRGKGNFGQVWAILGKFRQVWASLGKFGQVWASLDKFGQVWASLGKLGQIRKMEKKGTKILVVSEEEKVRSKDNKLGQAGPSWAKLSHGKIKVKHNLIGE